ncbi:MAG TPA: hypothetical protein VE961_26740 [Pyrinomonadaceae bacterium]|nr:hypothetical protein [Pyrinomonadaceae bacterium]
MKTCGKREVTSLGLLILALSAVLVSGKTANAQADPGETAYQAYGTFSQPVVGAVFEYFSVPTGDRLVIERLEIGMQVPHNQPALVQSLDQLTLTTTVNGAQVTHHLPVPTFKGSVGAQDGYSLVIDVNFYADHTPLNYDFWVLWPTSLVVTSLDVGAVVIGHLVCPRALTCPTVAGSTSSTETADTSATAATKPRPVKALEPNKVARLRRW